MVFLGDWLRGDWLREAVPVPMRGTDAGQKGVSPPGACSVANSGSLSEG